MTREWRQRCCASEETVRSRHGVRDETIWSQSFAHFKTKGQAARVGCVANRTGEHGECGSRGLRGVGHASVSHNWRARFVFQDHPLAVATCRSPIRPATIETTEFPDAAGARQPDSRIDQTARERVRIDPQNRSIYLLNRIYFESSIRVFGLHRQPPRPDGRGGRFA